MATRRPKWHPPPPPTPKILHLPRRSRRSRTVATAAKLTFPPPPPATTTTVPAGRRHDHDLLPCSSQFTSNEKCQFHGMEGEREGEGFVVLEKEAVLRSAVDSLVSGRRKIDGSENAGLAMEGVHWKLKGLRIRCSNGGENKGLEGGWSNFDKKALLLRRRLRESNVREMMPKKKVDDDDEEEEEKVCVNEIMKKNGLSEVEMLRRRMECISRGMLDKMEEYGTFLSFSRDQAHDNGSGKATVPLEKAFPGQHNQMRKCSGRCRAVVERLVEEVKAETEQWVEMQGMLEQVKGEMDDLRCSRDFWERCAIQSDQKLRSTTSQVMEWKQRALGFQSQVSELESEVEALRRELQQRSCRSSSPRRCSSTQKKKGKENKEEEKQRRRPLREICNLSTVKTSSAGRPAIGYMA